MIWLRWANKQHQVALSCDNSIIESKFSRLSQYQFRIIRKKEWAPLEERWSTCSTGLWVLFEKKKKKQKEKSNFHFFFVNASPRENKMSLQNKKKIEWLRNKEAVVCEQLENKGQVGESEYVDVFDVCTKWWQGTGLYATIWWKGHEARSFKK